MKAAFDAQREFLVKVSKCKRPPDSALEGLLKPTSEKISAIIVSMSQNTKYHCDLEAEMKYCVKFEFCLNTIAVIEVLAKYSHT